MSPTSEKKLEPKKPKGPSKAELEKIHRKVYFDILNGYTATKIDGKKAYIRHFDLETQTAVDSYYKEVYAEVREKGLMTEEELLEQLDTDGTWTQKEEEEIKSLEKKLDGNNATLAKALNKDMKVLLEKNIAELEETIKEKRAKKQGLLHNTCEEIADKKSSDLVVQLSFVQEDKKSLVYDEDSFSLLEREEITALIAKYNTEAQYLTSDTIKKISVADFFTSYYNLVEDNPSRFFNQPIHELTFFQVNLLTYARVFGNILKNLDPPEHIRENPDKLLAFAKTENKKREAAERKQKTDSKSGPATFG